MASEQVLGQDFGQEIWAGRAEAAVEPLGSEEASEHILDLKGNSQVKIGFKGGNCSFHHPFIHCFILVSAAVNLEPILGRLGTRLHTHTH